MLFDMISNLLDSQMSSWSLMAIKSPVARLMALKKLLFDEFPSFKLKMMAVKNSILIDDYQLCLLARVRFTPSEIGNILGVKPSNVTMKRKRMLNALFDKIGNAKEFDKLLLSLC